MAAARGVGGKEGGGAVFWRLPQPTARPSPRAPQRVGPLTVWAAPPVPGADTVPIAPRGGRAGGGRMSLRGPEGRRASPPPPSPLLSSPRLTRSDRARAGCRRSRGAWSLLPLREETGSGERRQAGRRTGWRRRQPSRK